MENPNLTSLLELICSTAEKFGERPLFMYSECDEDKVITYAQFNEYVQSIARGMINTGIGGKRVGIIGGTSPQWVAAYLASIITGGVAIPFDAGLNMDEIPKFVNFSDAEVFFATEKVYNYLSEHRSEMPCLKHVILLDSSRRDTEKCEFGTFSSLYSIGYNHPEIEIPEQDTEKMSELLFTSGTTGSSKGVMLSQKNVVAVINNGHERLYDILSPDDVMLSVLPIHHTYELSCGILAPMSFGAAVAINDSLRNVSKSMKKYRPTVMTLVPLFIDKLYDTVQRTVAKQNKEKIFAFAGAVSHAANAVGINIGGVLFKDVAKAFGGRLKTLVSGGAALNPKYVPLFRDMGIKIIQGYGITECAPLIAAVPVKSYNPKSCGKPLDNLQVLIDKENPTDDFGEIVVKGDNVFMGYYKNEEATAAVLSNGWFRTGDYGTMDKDGFLYITGRKKNVIVLQGGKNVFPEEIEEYLADIPLIAECVVLGREDEAHNVTITAIVYPNYDRAKEEGIAGEENIRKAIEDAVRANNRRMSNYKHITAVEFREEPFEKTTSQKIKRHLVK